MKEMLHSVLKTKKFVVTEPIIKLALTYNLNLNEFLVLMFLDNNYNDNFDLDLIATSLSIPSEVVMEAFNSLMVKKLVSLETSRDIDGRINEIVNLNNIYEDISLNTVKEVEKESIFTIFERELGRTISSFEIELINGWLMAGTSEELVIAALKEAIYNGATNFRYIDAIIHEWTKKGFKTENDVKRHLESRREKKENSKPELFDYNWLEDDE
ncbi:MAG: DnaD domain-containing protein [Bacilli bacterium]